MSRYDVEITKWNEKAQAVLERRKNWKQTDTYDSTFGVLPMLQPVHAFFDRIGEPGITVLDFGCGMGWSTLLLAKKAAAVKAIDISSGEIAVLEEWAKRNGISNIETRTGDGEHLPYDDAQFDYVFGNAILHHLELHKCVPEIARVLKPGGRAAFCEPSAQNPLATAYRYVKHHYIEDHVGTDRPLRLQDRDTFTSYFSHVEFRPTSFFREFRGLESLDRMLVKTPLLKRYATYIAVLAEK